MQNVIFFSKGSLNSLHVSYFVYCRGKSTILSKWFTRQNKFRVNGPTCVYYTMPLPYLAKVQHPRSPRDL